MKSLSIAVLALVNNVAAIKLVEEWTPAQSRELFEKQVAQASATVATQVKNENDRVAANRLLDNNDIRETFNEKARVTAGRIAMMRGGPPSQYGGGHWLAPKAASLAQKEEEAPSPWNPAESRRVFDAHVKTAASVVATQVRNENARVAANRLLDDNDIRETFNEKARVTAGRVAMMRGGPSTQYWNAPPAPKKDAQSLMQKEEEGPWNPSKSRAVFEKSVQAAASTVANEVSIENKRVAANRLLDDNDIRETFNEKARVRAGQIAMQRGGPSTQYWNAPPPKKDAGSLAQLETSDQKSDIGEPQYDPSTYRFVHENVDVLPTLRPGMHTITGYQ